MLRTLLIAFGIVEILAPRPVIAACERIGLENPAEARLRPRAIELARLEGLAVVWLLVRGRRRPSLVGRLLGLAGVVAVLSPRPLVRLTQVVAYENTDELELKPWVAPAARLLGVCYLTVVAFAGRVDGPADEASGRRVDAAQGATDVAAGADRAGGADGADGEDWANGADSEGFLTRCVRSIPS